MAEKYGMLPTEVLSRASTVDLQLHLHSEKYKQREQLKARGENTADTYSETEANEVYEQWMHSRSMQKDSKKT